MRDLLAYVGLGILAPAAVAAALAWFFRRTLRAGPAERYVLATALAAGFFAGHAILPGFGQLAPTSRWQWLPYLGVMAAVVAALHAEMRALRIAKWSLVAIAAILSAWKLVPAGDVLGIPRYAWVALLALYLSLLTAGLEALPDRLSGPALPALLAGVAAALMVVLVAAAVSARFAQLAGLLSGALLGCWLACLRLGELPSAIRGLAPVYATLVGGLAFVACVDKDPPLTVLLAMPAAPLALWTCAIGPASRLTGRAAIAVQTATVLVPLLAAGAIACLSGLPTTDAW